MRPPVRPQGEAPRKTYIEFIRDQAARLRRALPAEPPATEAAWQARLAKVRAGLMGSFGRMPDVPCDLAPEILGTIRRDGYVIERLTFQSRPGVRVTATLYRPDPLKVRTAAVLSVHGHWAWARIDPHVQARCIGLARLGYVAMAVDAFGAGERAIDPKPGTYHGALDGASLWPTGVSLLGLQVYDNRRAVDYLISRTEVDPKRLAITGASGGGNQSLYAGATDDRLAAVVPVCGVGTYDAYLGTGCCVCEMNVGGMTYATTGDLLASMAPRALLVINATKDAVQFSVAEAAKSVAFARERYKALGVNEKLKHVPVESGHDYNQAMREAMYGWLDRWLRDKGDGSPVTEPALTLEDPQVLRCYPDGPSRPKTIVTIPEFALSEGRARLAALPKAPDHPQRWEADAMHIREVLYRMVLGPNYDGADAVPPAPPQLDRDPSGPGLATPTGSGLVLKGRSLVPGPRSRTVVLLIRAEGEATPDDPLAKPLAETGRDVVSVDLRVPGRAKTQDGGVRGVTDHNEAEWGLWIGRPLLGQWVEDALTWLDALVASSGRPVEIVGVGPFGLVGLIAAGLRPSKVKQVGLIDPLVSFVGKDATPWTKMPMGLIVPNLLETADVGQLAALVAPARMVIAGGVEPSSERATPARIAEGFGFTRSVYATLKSADRLTLLDSGDLPGFAKAFAVG
jgi:dienelactone hydrolase